MKHLTIRVLDRDTLNKVEVLEGYFLQTNKAGYVVFRDVDGTAHMLHTSRFVVTVN